MLRMWMLRCAGKSQCQQSQSRKSLCQQSQSCAVAWHTFVVVQALVPTVSIYIYICLFYIGSGPLLFETHATSLGAILNCTSLCADQYRTVFSVPSQCCYPPFFILFLPLLIVQLLSPLLKFLPPCNMFFRSRRLFSLLFP